MNKVFIVGIAGGSAGGKSTFANKLKEMNNVEIGYAVNLT